MGEPWWRSAVVYQVYIRSFADGDGDGTGDIAGLRDRLPYIAGLGVDAIWINPWYPSPMADSGYDVADYRDIEPVFGDLAAAEALIDDAHGLGLKVILDVVPNHSSDQHALFQAALAAGPDSLERALYVFRDGEQAPNDWRSQFGGPAWTCTEDGQWYLHLFAPGQPDFDWTHPAVAEEFDATLRFWFDRGVDGFRIDVAHGVAKLAGLPDVGAMRWPLPAGSAESHPHWDVEAVHDVWRRWRAIADTYPGDRTFVAEAWIDDGDRLARYLRPDELHTAFNFDFLMTAWRAADLRATIDRTLRAHAAVGAPATWVLANHDVIRTVSRYARPQDGPYPGDPTDLTAPADLELGRRRARAAALLLLALPGGAYVYQGEELGLAEVEDLPDAARQDPTFAQSGGQRVGRDGCRVPLPWAGTAPPFGFSPDNATGAPWLPQPGWFAGQTVADQRRDPDSMLALYRTALGLRHELPALGDGQLRWISAPDAEVLHFERDPEFACVINFGPEPAELPAGHTVLLASGPTPAGALPPDTAVWLRRP